MHNLDFPQTYILVLLCYQGNTEHSKCKQVIILTKQQAYSGTISRAIAETLLKIVFL